MYTPTTRNSHTARERVFEFVTEYKQANDGEFPTIREIADGVGLASTNTVAMHIDQLIKTGRFSVRYKKGGTRMILVNGGQWVFTQSPTAQ
jgi:SOS-response transcriptional repressor LexA